MVWIAIAATVLLACAGLAVNHFASDPFRTLEPFPMETYAGNYHALEGSRFKATLRVQGSVVGQHLSSNFAPFQHKLSRDVD